MVNLNRCYLPVLIINLPKSGAVIMFCLFVYSNGRKGMMMVL